MAVTEKRLDDEEALRMPDPNPSERPEGWPEKCGNCGAPWTEIVFEIVDGFCCRARGGTSGGECKVTDDRVAANYLRRALAAEQENARLLEQLREAPDWSYVRRLESALEQIAAADLNLKACYSVARQALADSGEASGEAG